jgi:hypothetical protein
MKFIKHGSFQCLKEVMVVNKENKTEKVTENELWMDYEEP